jgi:hypothetical protein
MKKIKNRKENNKFLHFFFYIFFTVFTRCDVVGTWSSTYHSSSSSFSSPSGFIFKLEKLVNRSELEGISLQQSKSRKTVRVYPSEQTKFLTRISWKKVI